MTELVYLKNDEAVCDSLQVAEKFHKEHRNVLQNIDNLIAENSAVQNMFRQSHYKADKPYWIRVGAMVIGFILVLLAWYLVFGY